MLTRVVITALTDRRNVSGYASELEYFAAETHLVVVPGVIFSSHLSVYHLVRSFAVLLFAFSRGRSHVFPFALHCSISLRSAEVLTDDELDQARLTTLCQKIRTLSKDDGIKASHKKHPRL